MTLGKFKDGYFRFAQAVRGYTTAAVFEQAGGQSLLVSSAGGPPTLRILMQPPFPPETAVIPLEWRWMERSPAGEPSPDPGSGE